MKPPRGAFWLGENYRGVLLGHAESSRAGRSLRSYLLVYDDCARWRRCARGFQLQENHVCSGRTTLNVLDQDSYHHAVRVRTLGALLLIDIGQGDLAVLAGPMEVRIFPEAGRGPVRKQILAAIRALRRVGRPAEPLPPSALPRSLVRRVKRTEAARRRLGSVAAAAAALDITREQARRLLQLAPATRGVTAVSCERRSLDG